MTESTKQNPSFEASLQRLEEIVSLLNNGKAPLAESLTLFEEGAKLLGYCDGQLQQAEEKVALLSPDSNGKVQSTTFFPEEG